MLTVAIQAGGRSNRMGQDKALVRLGGRPLIEHLLRRLEGIGDEILITTNRPEGLAYLGLRLAPDLQPGAGTLPGMLTALEAAQGDQVLLLACDLPFVSRPLLEHMLSHAGQADAVVPRRGGEFEPLHALYARSCLEHVRSALARGDRRMISFFPAIKLLTIEEPTLNQLDPSGLSFFNINTPDDLRRAERLLKRHSQTSR